MYGSQHGDIRSFARDESTCGTRIGKSTSQSLADVVLETIGSVILRASVAWVSMYLRKPTPRQNPADLIRRSGFAAFTIASVARPRKQWGDADCPSGQPEATIFRLRVRLGRYLFSNWKSIQRHPTPSEIRGQIMRIGQIARDIPSLSSHRQGARGIHPDRMFHRHANFANRSGNPAIARIPTGALCFCLSKSAISSESDAARIESFPDGDINRNKQE